MKYRRARKTYRKKRAYKKRRYFKSKLRRARNDAVISRKIVTYIDVVESNTTNVGSIIVNWFGTANTSLTLNALPLADGEHTDACGRFKYWKVTYLKAKFYVNDMIQISNESFTGSWGFGQMHIASDTNGAVLENSDAPLNFTSRPDYIMTPCLRGKTYTKRFNPLKYLKKHHPLAAGWRNSEEGTSIGNLFFTAFRMDTVNLGEGVPLGRLAVTSYIKYMNYRVAGI